MQLHFLPYTLGSCWPRVSSVNWEPRSVVMTPPVTLTRAGWVKQGLLGDEEGNVARGGDASQRERERVQVVTF